QAVQDAIRAAPLPAALSTHLQAFMAEAGGQHGRGIIVRSSATVEDSERHSFAGIFESLPCYTVDEVQQAIRRVWASVFSARAFSYYGTAGLRHIPAMALVLQPFIEADYSGVMFTSFPNPQNEPQLLVEYVPGSGDKL